MLGAHGRFSIPDKPESIAGLLASFTKDVGHLLRLQSAMKAHAHNAIIVNDIKYIVYIIYIIYIIYYIQ